MSSNDDHDDQGGYEVGYGKPPRSTRFRKGTSGNPKGRPKGSKNIAQLVEQVCQELVRVKGEDGRYHWIPKIKVVLMQMINQAARGDFKASRALFATLKMFPKVIEGPPLVPPQLIINFVDPKDTRLPDGLNESTECREREEAPPEEFENCEDSW